MTLEQLYLTYVMTLEPHEYCMSFEQFLDWVNGTGGK